MIGKPTSCGDDPVHRITLGDFELTVLSDGTYRMDGGAMFGVIPKVMWEKRIQPDERNTIPLALNSLLVRTGKQNILVETGIGSKLSEKSQSIYQNHARQVLRAGGRVAARPRTARARPRQLHDRQLRSPGRERTDAVAQR